MIMKYQLVLQLPASSVMDYREMIEIEETIIEGFCELGDVDGRDAGAGQMNIFILTNEPQLAFERIKALLEPKNAMFDFRVAYREIKKNDYTIIHPSGLTHFAIK